MPALKQVEEEAPNRRVGLLELVYEDDPDLLALIFRVSSPSSLPM